MKKNLLYALALILAPLMLTAQEKSLHEVNVGDFKDLRVIDNINVVYTNSADSAGMVKFHAIPSMADKVMLTNNTKGRLTIQVATEVVDNPNLPIVYVYSNFLESVENAGDSTVRVLSVAPAPSIKIKLSDNGKIIANNINGTEVEASILTGKGKILVNGKCSTAILKNLGTGEIQADKLIADNVYCHIAGTGVIGCNAKNILSIKGIGTGKVYYVGTPKEIKTFKLGSIKAIPLDPQ